MACAARASNAFALELYQELRAQRGNVAFSPLAIWAGLALLRHAAGDRAAAEIEQVLHLDTMPPDQRGEAYEELARAWTSRHPGVRLTLSSELFVPEQIPIDPDFATRIRQESKWTLTRVGRDERSPLPSRALGSWADTLGGTFATASARAALALAQRATCTGRWAQPFDPDETLDMPFWTDATRNVLVRLMMQSGPFRLAEVPEDGLQLLELPYEGQELAMVLLLPSAPEGLDEVERRLGEPDTLQGWLGGLEQGEVRVGLPRWGILGPVAIRLEQSLRALGLRSLFDPTTAPLERLAKLPVGAEHPYLAAALQATNVLVPGAEGGAARRSRRGTPEPERHASFVVNRPFLFLVRDLRTGVILLMGVVRDPHG